MKNLLKINNPGYFLLLFFGLSYYIFVLYDNHESVIYNFQYFLYDYHFQFIKRGLIGTIMNFIPITLNEYRFISISTVLLALLGMMFVKIIDNLNFFNKSFNYFLVSLLVISPALLKNLWFDIGRLDIFGIFYCLLFLLPLKKTIIHYIFILSPLVLLIHEGFFFLWLPSYFACWFIKNEMKFTNKNIIILGLFIFLSLIVLFIINKFGKISVDFNEFENYIKSKTPGEVAVENTVITESIYKKIQESILFNFTHIKFWFLGFVNLFSMIYIIKIYCRLFKINLLRYKIIFLPVFFTFLMFFLGLDGLRWFSNMCFSLYIMLLAILIDNKDKIKKEVDIINSNEFYFMFFILLIMLPFNSLGILL
ncbi:MAG: hypothetical protein LBP34_08095 [Flavobacteriaceae bacterium]|jgi:hypothetical protein|nr:hypothetical protein [Flavobacteriaceae bacterium]